MNDETSNKLHIRIKNISNLVLKFNIRVTVDWRKWDFFFERFVQFSKLLFVDTSVYITLVRMDVGKTYNHAIWELPSKVSVSSEKFRQEFL